MLELTLFRVIIWFNVDFTFLAFLQVIWAIGASMIVLSAIVRLPLAALAAIAGVILIGHNALDGIRLPFWTPGSDFPAPGFGGAVWLLLHQFGLFPVGGWPGPIVLVQYPLLPWIGLVTAGYVMAAIYAWPGERRRRMLALTAVAMLAAFVVLRTFNIYGDPTDWAPQPTFVQSAMAFMNVQKYPPSLSYVLVTLVPALLALAALDGRTIAGGFWGAVVTFGRVPFFFYVLQWLTAHVSGMIVTAVQGKSIDGYFKHLLDLLPAPARLRRAAVDGLRLLDRQPARDVPAVPLVRRRQGAAPRVVAQLPVARTPRARPMPPSRRVYRQPGAPRRHRLRPRRS